MCEWVSLRVYLKICQIASLNSWSSFYRFIFLLNLSHTIYLYTIPLPPSFYIQLITIPSSSLPVALTPTPTLSSYLIQYCQFSFLKDKDTGPLTRIRLKTVMTLQDRMLPYSRPCQQLQTGLLTIRSWRDRVKMRE